MTSKPATLGELRKIPGYAPGSARRTVKDELRANILRKLEAGEPLFPGIHGYEETVLPQIANALLARHNFILLGLRGQAKSRILRGLVDFLDKEIPYISGCEIHDDPLAPMCRACRDLIAEQGEATPIAWLAARRALRRKAGHAGRNHRGHSRRRGPHQGGALAAAHWATNSPSTTACCPAPIAASSP